jgi:uncharacterized protein (TIGR03067 family)
MTRWLVLSVLVGSLAFVGVGADGFEDRGENLDDAAEMSKLEGNWNLIRSEYKGNLGAIGTQKNGLFIEDGKIFWTVDGREAGRQKGDLTIDPTTSPMSIEVEITRGSDIGKKMLGIYEIKGDKLTICWADPGSEKRPKKFVTKTAIGAGTVLQTYQALDREPPAAKAATTSPRKGAGRVEAAGETRTLDGVWKLTRKEHKGNLRPGVDRGKDGLFIEDGKIFWTVDGREAGRQKGDLTIDPTTSPMSIEVEITRGSDIGKKMLGIYEVKGDKLTICWADPGVEKRPTKFVTKTAIGAGASLETYQAIDDEKPAAKGKATASRKGASRVDPAAESKILEGNWKLTRMEVKGKLWPGSDRGKDGLFIEDGKIFWTVEGREAGGQKGDLTVDPSTAPKSIEVEITRGSLIGKKMLGIYEIKGKKLTICWGEPDSEKRPTKFVTRTTSGAGSFLETYQKVDD